MTPFAPTPDAVGRHVLLVDDTFVTGARVQSAAAALHRGGADVVAALVVGRLIAFHPDWPDNRAVFDRARAAGFDFESCCLH